MYYAYTSGLAFSRKQQIVVFPATCHGAVARVSVSGCPEIDVGITTSNTVILAEAKWLSGIGAAQGKAKDKNQIQLRGEFLAKYGAGILFPGRPHKVVLGISLLPNAFKDTTPKGVSLRKTFWQHLSALPSHPLVDELTRYVEWKTINSRMKRKSDK